MDDKKIRHIVLMLVVICGILILNTTTEYFVGSWALAVRVVVGFAAIIVGLALQVCELRNDVKGGGIGRREVTVAHAIDKHG